MCIRDRLSEELDFSYSHDTLTGLANRSRYEANKANLAMLNERVGIFCDDTRDAIKGGCFDAREPGYVEGKPGSFWDIGAAVAAWCRSDRLPPHAPSQIVSYVSAHDNFTQMCIRDRSWAAP